MDYTATSTQILVAIENLGATSTQILVAIKDLGNMYALGSAATLAVVAALFFAKVWK